MLNPIKFKSKDYDKIWIVSDLHLNQQSGVILKDRGFSSLKEHDDYLEKYWKDNITENSLVINIGDIVFNDPKGEFFDRVADWPAKDHVLLWGNHNSGSKNIFRARLNQLLIDENTEIYPLRYKNVLFVGNLLEIKIDSKNIVLCHFPLAVHNNHGKGYWHLMGHSHHSFPDTHFDNPKGLTCDCGVDSAFRHSNFTKPFFTLEDIKDIMSKKSFNQKDHHSEKTT